MELSILHFEGAVGQNFYKMIYFYPCFILAKSTDPDEMPLYDAIHLGIHCLPKYLFTDIKIETENDSLESWNVHHENTFGHLL